MGFQPKNLFKHDIKMLFPCDGACSIFFGTVFPIIGAITSTFLGLSTLPAVLQVSKTRELKQLNIIPLALLLMNALAWILYSFIMANYYIFFANIVNFGACLFYVLTCLPLETIDRQTLITRIMVILGSCLLCLGAVCFITFKDDETARIQISGWGSVLILLIFYASPLSTMRTVISTKCSESIHVNLAIATLVNGNIVCLYRFFVDVIRYFCIRSVHIVPESTWNDHCNNSDCVVFYVP
jgi:solute carrier family 50 (sugar transporter)